ncbi:hypothetical protein Tco_0327227 [Tanacetum coccineum]
MVVVGWFESASKRGLSKIDIDILSGHGNYCNFHIDDLVPTDLDDGKDFEAYEEREEFKRRICHLLKLEQKKPLLLPRKGFEVTSYSNGPLEKYAIMRKVHHDDWLRMEKNVDWLHNALFRENDNGALVTRLTDPISSFLFLYQVELVDIVKSRVGYSGSGVGRRDESIDSAFARFNTIITSLKALDEGYSSKNYVRKQFLGLCYPKWRARKDFEIVKARGERRFLALKAKKESSDEECSTSGSEDEEYAMASDSGEEDDEKVKDETCLVTQASNAVCSDSSYFSDENSSIDDLALDNEYDKLCKMSLKTITKNKRLKDTRNSLEKELSKLKEKLSTLEKNKGIDLECTKCKLLKIEK